MSPASAVDWPGLDFCTTCLAPRGVPCRSLRDAAVTVARPHPGRLGWRPATVVDQGTIHPDGPWVLHLRPPCKWLSLNDSRGEHWAAKARKVEAWRKASMQAAERAGLPTGLARVRVDAEFRFVDARDRDNDNRTGTMKPVIDGLAAPRPITRGKRKGQMSPGYGLVADDNTSHIEYAHVIGAPIPRATPRGVDGLLTLTITVLDRGAAVADPVEAVDLTRL